MSDEIKKYMADVLKAIGFIEDFVGEKRNFSQYQKNFKTKFAVERNLEIIGEAINNILKTNPDIAISSARKIVDMRNRLIHAYDAIDDYIVWEVVNNHLPTLKKELDILLGENL